MVAGFFSLTHRCFLVLPISNTFIGHNGCQEFSMYIDNIDITHFDIADLIFAIFCNYLSDFNVYSDFSYGDGCRVTT